MTLRPLFARIEAGELRAYTSVMIEEFYPRLAPRMRQLRTFPNLILVEVAPADLDAMDEAMLTYHLRPRDPLHLAAMRKCTRAFRIVYTATTGAAGRSEGGRPGERLPDLGRALMSGCSPLASWRLTRYNEAPSRSTITQRCSHDTARTRLTRHRGSPGGL